MNGIEWIGSDPLWQALGYALLHFIWQGALVALGLAGVLLLLRRHTARTRYAVACGALLLLLVLAVATFVMHYAPVSSMAATGMQPVEPATWVEAVAPLPDRATQTAASTAGQVEGNAWPAVLLPWVVSFWMVGVLLLSLRYLAGWTYTLRLRRSGRREVGQQWHDLLDDVARRLDLRHPVRLFSSTRVKVPMVVGWLRPVVLVPVAVLAGLSVPQVEMILVHELAHVRRHDYLVNLVQAVAETLLFYHPAVWWISRRIRIEREHCCDNVVVALCGDAVGYAGTLARLETVRQGTFRLAPAATDGSLLERIQRLLEDPVPSSTWAMRWMAGFLFLGMLLIGLRLPSAVQAVWERIVEAEVTEEAVAEEQDARLQRRAERTGEVPDIEHIEEIIDRMVAHSISSDELEDLFNGPDATVSEGDRKKVAFLERLVFEGELLEQKQALDALVQTRPYSVSYPALLRIIATHPRAEIRSGTLEGIARMGEEAALPILEHVAFEDADASVQNRALKVLLRMPDDGVVPVLARIAARHPQDLMRAGAEQGMAEKAARARMNATQARASYNAILGQIDRALDSEADAVAQKEFLETLRARLALEMEMIEAREAVEREATVSLQEALERLNHPLAHVRAAAVEQVGELQREDVIPILVRIAFEDGSIRVQLEALGALRKREDGNGLPWLEHIAQTHAREAMRNEAVQWLGRLGNASMAPVLQQIALEDQSPGVQRKALDALRALPNDAGRPALHRIAETHPAAWMRSEARR